MGIAIYTGDRVDQLVPVAQNDDTSPGQTSL